MRVFEDEVAISPFALDVPTSSKHQGKSGNGRKRIQVAGICAEMETGRNRTRDKIRG